jgi:hypothetical protein
MNIIINSVEGPMNSTYPQDRLLRQFKEFQQLNARGYTIEANLYINAVIRELTELRNAQCYFSRIVELYEIDVATIESIINMIDESLKPISRISDFLAIECEAIYLCFAADGIKNKDSLTEITQHLTAIKDLRVKILTTENQDADIDEAQWNDIVCKAKGRHSLLH